MDIRYDVPLPTPTGAAGGRPIAYPWPDMRPGGSAFFPGKADAVAASLNRWCKKRPGQRFVTRKATEAGVAGVRVWRAE